VRLSFTPIKNRKSYDFVYLRFKEETGSQRHRTELRLCFYSSEASLGSCTRVRSKAPILRNTLHEITQSGLADHTSYNLVHIICHRKPTSRLCKFSQLIVRSSTHSPIKQGFHITKYVTQIGVVNECDKMKSRTNCDLHTTFHFHCIIFFFNWLLQSLSDLGLP
jgi:hypothetical protein